MKDTFQITSKGQVTIPLKFREQLGLLPLTKIRFERRGDMLVLKKDGSKGKQSKRANRILKAANNANFKIDFKDTDEAIRFMRGHVD